MHLALRADGSIDEPSQQHTQHTWARVRELGLGLGLGLAQQHTQHTGLGLGS